MERVLIGPGSRRGLGPELERLAVTGAVLVCSRTLAERSPFAREVERLIGERHRSTFTGLSQHTPEAAVAALATEIRGSRADALISLGGGSVIDGCKVALHQVGVEPGLHVALPTTLSGAEFTAPAGVTESASRQKRRVVDRGTAPRVVILDPELTLATPPDLWLGSGMRALDHAVETLLSPVQDPLAQELALMAVPKLLRALCRCREDPAALGPRGEAQVAAWWAALGLASVPMGPSHSLGKLLGSPFDIPHGITSAVLLPVVIERTAELEPERVALLAPAFGVTSATEVAPSCRRLAQDLGLPTTLAGAGLSRADLPRYLDSLPPQWRDPVASAY